MDIKYKAEKKQWHLQACGEQMQPLVINTDSVYNSGEDFGTLAKNLASTVHIWGMLNGGISGSYANSGGLDNFSHYNCGFLSGLTWHPGCVTLLI